MASFHFKSWYHSILDYSWWKLLTLLCVVFILINVCFGLLYLFGLHGLNGVPPDVSYFGSFYICFCFSVQTLTTIGYGVLSPNSYCIHPKNSINSKKIRKIRYWFPNIDIHTVAVLEGFLSFIASALLTGIIFAKISRPTRLSRVIIFSDTAVVNRYALSDDVTARRSNVNLIIVKL